MNAPLDPDRILRAIAIKSHPDALWDTADVAEYLCTGSAEVRERLITRPGFPRPIRLPTATGGKGHPKWYAREIIAWAATHRERALNA